MIERWIELNCISNSIEITHSSGGCEYYLKESVRLHRATSNPYFESIAFSFAVCFLFCCDGVNFIGLHNTDGGHRLQHSMLFYAADFFFLQIIYHNLFETLLKSKTSDLIESINDRSNKAKKINWRENRKENTLLQGCVSLPNVRCDVGTQ